MLTNEEIIIELKKYLFKLRKIIEQEAVFSLFDIKIVNKRKIDDVLCCFEASLPEEYKQYVRNSSGRKLKSWTSYKKLMFVVKNKLTRNSDCYLVHYNEFISIVNGLVAMLRSDINNINRNP